MAELKCPICGHDNPPDVQYCQNCRASLRAPSGDAIQPGDMPTKKVTAELEPILPAWLRDARDNSRQPVENDIQDPTQSTRPVPPPSSDLLAGLQSQASDDDEEIPDWLAGITGETGRKKTQPEESNEVRFVELGGPDEFGADEQPKAVAPAAPEPAREDPSGLPAWLANLSTSQEPASKNDDLSDWFKKADDAPAEKPLPEAEPARGAVEPFADATVPLAEESDADWLNSLKADASAPAESVSEVNPFEDVELPAWLKGDAPAVSASATSGADDMADWLKSLDAAETPKAEVPSAPSPAEPIDFDTPDWIKNMGASGTPAPEAAVPNPFDVELPDWLKGPSAAPAVPAAEADNLPPWLGNAAEVVPPSAPAPAFTDLQTGDLTAPETPEWLSNLRAAQVETPSGEQPTPSLTPEGDNAIFTETPLSGGDIDSLFTEVPDWLTGAASTAPTPTEPLAAAGESEPLISPASLPSWVQAMRPVEASMNTTPRGATTNEESLETRGPLAGLHGVLPSAAAMVASSKPKAQSIKLLADDEQQAQAELLEQILAAEARPEPMASVPQLASQRALRITIGVLLFIVLLASVIVGTQIFPLPLGQPAETMAAFRVVDTAIPPDAPVLLVFDYEPSLAGEMESVAAPLLDHMIVKQHPHLALLSTSPTGSALAERLLSGPLSELNYHSGVQYMDLGYLPGGLSGVRAFAQDPLHTIRFTTDASAFNLNPASVWESAPLQGVTSFSNFAAIIVITDSADTGRMWIEQAASLRGSAQFVVISSSQAGPMLQPYYASGQINGLVTGLYDATVLEQNNANRPGLARRYWDSYNFGLILALVLLVGGALWNLLAGLRERAMSKEVG